MPNPKRRTSSARRDRRRSHDGLSVAATTTCNNCGAIRRPHHVCGACGWYDGRQAIEVEEE